MTDPRQAIADILDTCLTADTPETCAQAWLALEAICDDARRARDEAGEWTAKVMQSANQYRTEANGTRIVVSKPKARTAWRKDEVRTDLLRLVPKVDRLLSPAGEVEGDAEVAFRLVDECLSWSSAKVTGLKRYGLDADEYCQVTEKPATVKVEHL